MPAPEPLLAVSPLALAAAGAVWTHRRRRLRLWAAVHELRRPMQGLTLAIEQDRRTAAEACCRQAQQALADLEDELDHAARSRLPRRVQLAELLAATQQRWCDRVEVEMPGKVLTVRADQASLERAIDNLLANSLEHGSRPVRLRAEAEVGWVLVEVRDAGPSAPSPDCARGPRRGHGLEIAAEIARECGGRLLPPAIGTAGTRTALRLPLVPPRADAA